MMQCPLFAFQYRPKQTRFFASEWKLIQKLNTPEKIQHFLYALPYNYEKNGETIFSFREAIRNQMAHCLEGAIIATTILEQYNYPPLLLDMESKDGIDHVLFLFKGNGKWGTIGSSKDIGLFGRRPVFKTIEDLVSSYYDPYINFEACITGYAVVNLNKLGTYDWRFSKRKLRKLEQFLIDYPHKPFITSKERYLDELNTYQAFKKKYPDQEPPACDYENRHEWWRPDR